METEFYPELTISVVDPALNQIAVTASKGDPKCNIVVQYYRERKLVDSENLFDARIGDISLVEVEL